MDDKMSPTNAIEHFLYNSILCYLGSPRVESIVSFFYTQLIRSGVAEHEEGKENIQGCIKSPEASTT